MSLIFKKPEISDKSDCQIILDQEKNIHIDSAFGTWFLWAEPFGTEICKFGNILFKKIGTDINNTVFEFPRGTKSISELRDAILMLVGYAKKMKLPEFKFTELLSSEILKLQNAFPEKFKITSNRDKYEYIYKSKDLALLPGKKYHGKRNHISKFSKMYDWKYKPIECKEKEKYINFLETWFYEKLSSEKIKDLQEYKVIKKAINNMKNLGLKGGIIEIHGNIVAFTMGEKINEKNFVVHFEKALSEYSTAYSVINSEFAKILLANKYEFINREEDLGIPGLRKAKLSYKPTVLIPKYDATLTDYRI